MPRDEASKAVISLRAALKQTQAEFAVTTMKVAVTTVARWETTNPPRGEALTRLRDASQRSAQRAAERNEVEKVLTLSKHSALFERLYLDDVMANLTKRGRRGPFFGDYYLFVTLKEPAQVAAVLEFLSNLPGEKSW